jgi:drug/metabolite transporter (DMT)-like permease
MKQEIKGMWYGFAGVALFSLTLPFTHMAVQGLDPLFVGFGRGALAGLLSPAVLWYLKAPLPSRGQWWPLAIIGLSVGFGFPVFSSIAMHSAPASHGAIVLGLLPLATALVGALRFGERPSCWFWVAAMSGSALVIGFALREGGGSFQMADLALFAAVVLAAIGYAEGGRLAQVMGGPQAIAWALMLCLPVSLPLSLWLGWHSGADLSVPPLAWIGFGYVSLFSMLIGFFFWYKGLAMGGIARVAQMQLLQPFLTLLGAALLTGDRLRLSNLVFAAAVIAVVGLGRRAKVRAAHSLDFAGCGDPSIRYATQDERGL